MLKILPIYFIIVVLHFACLLAVYRKLLTHYVYKQFYRLVEGFLSLTVGNMGGDGGSIPKRDDLVRTRGKQEQVRFFVLSWELHNFVKQ